MRQGGEPARFHDRHAIVGIGTDTVGIREVAETVDPAAPPGGRVAADDKVVEAEFFLQVLIPGIPGR